MKERSDNYKVSIEVTKEQAHDIMEALDLSSRLLMGQFDRVGDHLMKYANRFDNYLTNKEIIEEKLEEIKALIYPECGRSYFGIFSDACPEPSKIQWDLIQVIRYAMAWHENPNGGNTVNFNTPLKSSNTQELCTAKILEEKGD